jgi:predicted SnoaL-like aldol condensation-catalyzing enzyme
MHPAHRPRHLLVLVVALTMALIAPLGAAAAIPQDDDPGSPVPQPGTVMATTLFARVFNDVDAAAAEQLIAPDAVLHTTRFGDWIGPQGVLDYIAFVRRAYPDARFALSAVNVSGNTVTLNWTMTAGHVQMDPTEGPYPANVEIDGSAELALNDTSIASISLDERTVAITVPAPVA